MMGQLARFLFLAAAALADVLIPPPTGSLPGTPIGILFFGRNDSTIDGYTPMLTSLQLNSSGPTFVYFLTDGSTTAGDRAKELRTQCNVSSLIVASHSMQPSAGVLAQSFVQSNAAALGIDALVLISGFLQRTYRPGFRACAALAADAPVRSFQFPLGFLRDGAHDCSGELNYVMFPVPVLTIGGELDGVVRVGRFAEAFHVQRDNATLPVLLIPGMTHSSILVNTVIPGDVPATLGGDPDVVRAEIAQAFGAFLRSLSSSQHELSSWQSQTSELLTPLISALIDQEGSWFLSTSDDEHGSSPWAAAAQQAMADPLPTGWSWADSFNEFHLLSDETSIPPYYRDKHRANFTVLPSSTLSSSSVSQLRYVEITVTQAGIGLNGYAIIQEEKCQVLSELEDDGAGFVSAIEIATKLASRQLAFNITGQAAPESLDDGNRCAAINQAAYTWALSTASEQARSRHQLHGMAMRFLDDVKPTPPAGPWWIWNYLQSVRNPSSNTLDVSSWYAFYPLSGPAYGAGNHYCKLLSPARAMEWIYIASLVE